MYYIIISGLLTLSMIAAMSSAATTTAFAEEAEISATSGIMPAASDEISSTSYDVKSSSYLADVTLRDYYSGTLYIELQKKSGATYSYVTSQSTNFSNTRFPYLKHTRTTSSGTYRVKMVITFTNGNSYTRYSSDYSI